MFEPELRDLAFVPRWGILRRNRTQSVAEHSYFVAVYALQIADYLEWPGDRAALLAHALWHDVPECVTGDIPSPVKKHIGYNDAIRDNVVGLPNLMKGRFGAEDRVHMDPGRGNIVAIVRVADIFESICYLKDELALGNKDILRYIDSMTPHLWGAVDLLPNGPNISDLRSELSAYINNAQRSQLVE